MKVFIQIVDAKTGISQHGMIEEPVIKGKEIENALKHFGPSYPEISWYSHFTDGDLPNNPSIMTGFVEGTSKIVTVVAFELEHSLIPENIVMEASGTL